MNKKLFSGGVSLALLTNVLNLGLGFASGVITARALVPYERGLALQVTIIAATVASFALLGTDESVIYWSRGRVAHASLLVKSVTRRVVWETVLGLAVLAPLIILSEAGSTLGYWALLGVFILPLSNLIRMLLVPPRVGMSHGVWNAVRLTPQIANVTMLSVGWFRGWIDPLFVVQSLVAANLVTLAMALLLTRRFFRKGRVPLDPPMPASKDVTNYGVETWLAQLPSRLMPRMDLVLLAYLASPATVGVYAVASSLATVGFGFMQTVEQVIFPRLVSQGTVRSAGRGRALLQFSIFLAIGMIVVVVVGRPTIMAVYGQEYADAQGPLLGLVAGIAANITAVPLIAQLRAQGRLRTVMGSQWCGVAVFSITIFPLYELFSDVGVAVSASLFQCTVLLLLIAAIDRTTPRTGGATGTSPA